MTAFFIHAKARSREEQLRHPRGNDAIWCSVFDFFAPSREIVSSRFATLTTTYVLREVAESINRAR